MLRLGIILVAFSVLSVVHGVVVEVCDQDGVGTPLATPVGCVPSAYDALMIANPGDEVHFNALVHFLFSSEFDDDDHQSFLTIDTDDIHLTGLSPSTRTELRFVNDNVTVVHLPFGIRLGASDVSIEHFIFTQLDVVTMLPESFFSFLWIVPPSICMNTTGTTFCNTTNAAVVYDDTPLYNCEQITNFYFQNNEVFFAEHDQFLLAQGCVDLCGFHVNLNRMHNAEMYRVANLQYGAQWNCTNQTTSCSGLMKRTFDLMEPDCQNHDWRLNCWDVIPPYLLDPPVVWMPYYNCLCNTFAPYWSVDDEDNMVGFATITEAMDAGFVDVYVGNDPTYVTETTLIDRPVHLIGKVPDTNTAFLPEGLFEAFQFPGSGGNATCNCTVSLQIEACVQPAFVVLNELLFVDEVTVYMEQLTSFAVYRTQDELTQEEVEAVERVLWPCTGFGDDDDGADDDDPDDHGPLPLIVTQAHPDPGTAGAWDDQIVVEHSQFKQFDGAMADAALSALVMVDCTQPVVVRRNLFFDLWKAVYVSAPAVNITENTFYNATDFLHYSGIHLTMDSGSYGTQVRYNWFNGAISSQIGACTGDDDDHGSCIGGTGVLADGSILAEISCNAFTDNDHGVVFPCVSPGDEVCANCDMYSAPILVCLMYFPTHTCTDLILGANTHPGPEHSQFADNFTQCAIDNGVESVLTPDFISWLQSWLVRLCFLHLTMTSSDPFLLYLIDEETEPLIDPEDALCSAIAQEGFCTSHPVDCARPVGNRVIGNTFGHPSIDTVGAFNSPGGIYIASGSNAASENTIDDNVFIQSGYLKSLANQDAPALPGVDLVTSDPYWVFKHLLTQYYPTVVCYSVPELQATYWTVHQWHNISLPGEKDCNSTCTVRLEITESEWLAHKPDALWCSESSLLALTKELEWVTVPTVVDCDSDPMTWETDCFGDESLGDERPRYTRFVIGVGPPRGLAVNCEGGTMEPEDFSEDTLFYDDVCTAVMAATPNSTIWVDGICSVCHCHITKPYLHIRSFNPDEPAIFTPAEETDDDGNGDPCIHCLYGLRFLKGSTGGQVSDIHFNGYNGGSFTSFFVDRNSIHLGTAIVINPVPFMGQTFSSNYTSVDSFCWQFNTRWSDPDFNNEMACGWWINEQLYGEPTFQGMDLVKFDGNYRIYNNHFHNLERGIFVGPAAGQVYLYDNVFGEAPSMAKRLPHRDASVVEGIWLAPDHVNVDCSQNPDQPIIAKRNAQEIGWGDSDLTLAVYTDYADTDDDGGAVWKVCGNMFTPQVKRGLLVRTGQKGRCMMTETSRHIHVLDNYFNGQTQYGMAVHRVSGLAFRAPMNIALNTFTDFSEKIGSRALSLVAANVHVFQNAFVDGAESEVYGSYVLVANNYFTNSILSFTSNERIQNGISISGCNVASTRLTFEGSSVIGNSFLDSAVNYDAIHLQQRIVSNSNYVANYQPPMSYHRLEVSYNVFARQGSALSFGPSSSNALPGSPWHDAGFFPVLSCEESSTCLTIDAIISEISTLCSSAVPPFNNVAASCGTLETLLDDAFTTVCTQLAHPFCSVVQRDELTGDFEFCLTSVELAAISYAMNSEAIRSPTYATVAGLLSDLFHSPATSPGAIDIIFTGAKKRGVGYTGPASAIRGFTDTCGDLHNVASYGNVNDASVSVWPELDRNEFMNLDGTKGTCPVGQYLRIVPEENSCQCELCNSGSYPLSLMLTCGTGNPEDDNVLCPSASVQRGETGYCTEDVVCHSAVSSSDHSSSSSSSHSSWKSWIFPLGIILGSLCCCCIIVFFVMEVTKRAMQNPGYTEFDTVSTTQDIGNKSGGFSSSGSRRKIPVVVDDEARPLLHRNGKQYDGY